MKRSLRLIGALAALVFTHAAQAQPLPEDGDRAIELGREGKVLFDSKDYAAALDRFVRADAIVHSPVFVLYEARIHRALGKLLEAQKLLLKIDSETLSADAPKPWVTAKADAKTELASVQAAIPHLTIKLVNLAPGPLPEVRLDGAAVGPDVALEVDPGDHVVIVTPAGGTPIEAHPKALEGASIDVPITLPISATNPPINPNGPPETKAVPGSIVPGVVVLSAGIAGVAVGAVMGGLAISEAGKIPKECQTKPGCSGKTLSEANNVRDSADSFAKVSTGLLIAGAVVTVPGIVLLVVRPGGTPATKSSTAVTLGPASVGLVHRF